MKRRHLAVILVTALALSGCAALDGPQSDDQTASAGTDAETDAANAEFEKTVTVARAGVVGDPVGVEVTVQNTGDAEQTRDLSLRAGGETVTTESVTLAANTSETVVLTHTFDTTGTYTLSVAGVERPVAVYESPIAALSKSDSDNVPTVSEQRLAATGVFVQNGTEFDVQLNQTARIRTDPQSQRRYSKSRTSTQVSFLTNNQTSEKWVVGDTAYVKSKSEGEGPTYTAEPSDEFADSQNVTDPTILEYLTAERRGGQYIFHFDPRTSEAASTVWATFGGGDISAESITELTLEYRLDAALFRPVSSSASANLTDYEGFSTLEMQFEKEVRAYGVPVDIDVPDEVRENAQPASA